MARVVLGSGSDAVIAYLKREHRVSWLVRLANALAGFGLVSRSLREAVCCKHCTARGCACPEWLAAGEDGRGRAFLLIRQTESVDLPSSWPGRATWPRRRRLAQTLGRPWPGCTTPASPIPTSTPSTSCSVPERERSSCWTGSGLAGATRSAGGSVALDLAALHATLPDSWPLCASGCACLRAYLAELRRQSAATDLPARRGVCCQSGTRRLLAGLHVGFRRRVRLRHIREKCQPALRDETQDWLCLDGEALCVTSALARVWPGRSPEWLALDHQPVAASQEVTCRYLPVERQRHAVLVRRSRALAGTWGWLWPGNWSSPEQRLSVLLLRLQRHGIVAPRVLAMGQRQAGRRRRFVPADRAARVHPAAWTSRLRRQAQQRQRMPWEAGALLARLQQACCYLHPSADAAVFAVRIGAEPGLVLNRVEWITPARGPRPGLARRGYEQLRRALRQAGVSAAELEFFRAGYCRQQFGLDDAVPIPEEAIACPA